MLRDVQVGHDLEAAGDFFHQIKWQMDQLAKHAIEPDTHAEGSSPRLNVDVAGFGLDGIRHDVVDQRADFDALKRLAGLKVGGSLIHGFLWCAAMIDRLVSFFGRFVSKKLPII